MVYLVRLWKVKRMASERIVAITFVCVALASCGRTSEPANFAEAPVNATAFEVPGVSLPSGVVIGEGRAWISATNLDNADRLVRAVNASSSSTGLVAVRVRVAPGSQTRPWTDPGYLGARESIGVAGIDVLRERWLQSFAGDADVLSPVSEPLNSQRPERRDSPGSVLIVRTDRLADVPAVLGWSPYGSDLTPAEVSSVLRMWEDSLGWSLLELSRSALELKGSFPSTAPEQERLKVVAQIMSFSPGMYSARASLVEADRDLVEFSDSLYFTFDAA